MQVRGRAEQLKNVGGGGESLDDARGHLLMLSERRRDAVGFGEARKPEARRIRQDERPPLDLGDGPSRQCEIREARCSSHHIAIEEHVLAAERCGLHGQQRQDSRRKQHDLGPRFDAGAPEQAVEWSRQAQS